MTELSAESRCSWQAVFGADDRIDCALEAGHEGAHDYSLPVPVPEPHSCSYAPDGFLEPSGPCLSPGHPETVGFLDAAGPGRTVLVPADDLKIVLDMLIWVPDMTRKTWEAAHLRLRAALEVSGA